MRKKFLYLLSALALTATISAGTLMLAGCGPDGQTENLTDEPLKATTTIADWSEGEAPAVFESDGWTNGNPFNVQWTANNVAYENGVAKLTISDNPDGSEETFTEYYGGEMRTYQYFGYGDYEVRMKPAKKAGTASTFFTCTGDYDTNPNTGKPNPWDEIDIEFLGQDTTKVQFNYYVNGKGGHEYMYDLGFDASEDFHTYGFRWTEDYITWFVDGKPVYRVDATESNPMPSTAGRMLMNYWCGASAAENWMGKYSDPGEEGPEYQWIKTSAKVDWGEIPEPVETEEYEGDWSKIAAEAVEFDKSDNGVGTDYTITPSADNKSAKITYTKAGNYDNVNFVVTEAAVEKNWLHLTLKNNSSTATNNIRVSVIDARENNTYAVLNAFGFGNDNLLVTNAGEGTVLSLSPNMTMEVEIKFNGEADRIEMMFDSMQANALDKSGDVTISDIKFDVQGELDIPEVPVEDNNGVTINGTKVVFGGNVGGQPYVINTDDKTNSMNVTYTNATNNYNNVSADIKAIASDKNTFTATVKNNGTELVNLRVDIVASIKVNENTSVCNLSATMDGEAVNTDLSWGGSFFAIPAGKTVEIEVIYDTSYGPASLQFLIDTAINGDTATHAGDVTFSEMAFSGEAGETPDEPEEPVTPPSETPATVDVSKVTIQGSIVANDGPYTATAGNDNTINVKYDAVKGNSYLNVELAGMTADAQTHNVFTATIKNNGTETVNVRVNIQSTAQITANTQACNISATQDGVAVRTDAEWGGSFFTVEAGKTITIEIVYDYTQPQNVIQFMIDSHMGTETTHSGDITIGGMVFSSKVAE
ncbi:MAG: family 16 glycosylhydrolase [Oscillospiraceae bacterium]